MFPNVKKKVQPVFGDEMTVLIKEAVLPLYVPTNLKNVLKAVLTLFFVDVKDVIVLIVVHLTLCSNSHWPVFALNQMTFTESIFTICFENNSRPPSPNLTLQSTRYVRTS